MTESSRKRLHIVYWVVIVAMALFLGVSVLMNGVLGLSLLLGGKNSGGHGRAVDEYPVLQEEWSYGNGDVKVARIAVSGLITRQADRGLFAPGHDPTEQVLRQIRSARHDQSVKAILLEVDSPGGSISPSVEMYHELVRFKESAPQRHVVVFVRDLAASGGYLVAMAGDWLITEPTALIGSIGVILQSINIKGLSEKIGIHDTTFVSGDSKDLLNPFRDVSEQEREQLQGVVDSMYEQFLGIVSAGRDLDVEVLRPLADGRIMTADMALHNDLIDEVGYWPAAREACERILDTNEIKYVRYSQPMDFFSRLAQARFPLDLLLWKDEL